MGSNGDQRVPVTDVPALDEVGPEQSLHDGVLPPGLARGVVDQPVGVDGGQ